jgi:hypothetical protein
VRSGIASPSSLRNPAATPAASPSSSRTPTATRTDGRTAVAPYSSRTLTAAPATPTSAGARPSSPVLVTWTEALCRTEVELHRAPISGSLTGATPPGPRPCRQIGSLSRRIVETVPPDGSPSRRKGSAAVVAARRAPLGLLGPRGRRPSVWWGQLSTGRA